MEKQARSRRWTDPGEAWECGWDDRTTGELRSIEDGALAPRLRSVA